MASISHHRFENAGKPIHYAEVGSGPPVIFCHGFPELWYSWRHQLPAVAAAGWRAIAPDMRGYGESYCPGEISAYTHEQICSDMLALLDHLDAEKAVFVGHDWGGAIVWALARHFPQRVEAVVSFNTPFVPATRLNPLEMLRRRPGRFAYQIFFQEPGPAEAELERDPVKTFHAVFRSCRIQDESNLLYHTEKAAERGSFLTGAQSSSDLLSEEEIVIYAEAYRRTGFRGGLNWYRNMEENWRWNLSAGDAVMDMPVLMVSATEDPILSPAMTRGMEKFFSRLELKVLEHCGHWTQQEHPEKVNEILREFLRSLR